jgi:YidC/Oxa1 family membrane protein insertase
MILVAVVPSILFPRKRPLPGTPGSPDTSVALRDSQPAAPTPQDRPAMGANDRPTVRPTDRGANAATDTVWVTSDLYRLGFSTRGGELVAAELRQYRSFNATDAGSNVQLVPAGRAFLTNRLVAGADTASLSEWSFTPSATAVTVSSGGTQLTFTAARGDAQITLRYGFRPDDYRIDVRGEVEGLASTGAVLALGLSDGLRSVEADTVDDYRHYSIVTKAAKTEGRAFSSLDPGEVQRLNGPFEWVALKSKYFLLAALAIEPNAPQFGGAIVTGGPRSGKTATRAGVAVTMPVPGAGSWQYQVYLGPFEHRRLTAMGHDLDDANPYGGILRPIVHPVSIFVVNILLWMHETLGMSYGWVLVAFGVLVRLLLWPLNQKAMESSLRMQAVAPLMKEVQDKYKGDPERLQKEMMKLYKEHQVNPFGGCLPMFLPFPVLIALFFVFQNTIEFRGVPFLWLPDLARHDPLYIIPIAMGLSMFAMSKIGQRGVPKTPQTAMFLYVLPAMMTFFFFRFPSGLNLYYTVQNLVSIPQQYMLARRRLAQQQKTAPRPAAARDKS